MTNLIQEKTKGSFLTALLLLFLFLASLDVGNKYYYFVFAAFLIFTLKPGKSFRVDASTSSLFMFAIFWMFFSPTAKETVLGVIKPFTYLICYIMGYCFFDEAVIKKDNASLLKDFYKLVVIVSAGSFFHYLLNWYINGDATERDTIDIWTGEVRAATGQASFACLALAIAVACLFSKTGVKVKAVSLITVALAFGYNFVLSGRTLIFIALVLAAISFLHLLHTKKKGRMKALIILLVIILTIVFIYNNNIFGIKSFVESSLLYERFNGENSTYTGEDRRWDRKIYYLKNFFDHPFGGVHFRDDVGYAHDVFLDTYDEAGIFTFTAVIIYISASISHLIKCMKNKTLPFVFRQIILCVYIALYIEFMIEPVFQGIPALFAMFCLIDGALSKVLISNNTLPAIDK